MAEGKSGWLTPQFGVTVGLVVLGWISSLAVNNYRLTQAETTNKEQKTEIDLLKTQVPGIQFLGSKIDDLNKDVDKLTDKVDKLIERELNKP